MPKRDRQGRYRSRRNPFDVVDLLVKPLLAGAAAHIGTRAAKAATDRVTRIRKATRRRK